jgi:DnaJ-class molecular chaperone
MAVISSSSENKDISKAYKKLAVKYHPDKGGDEDIFKIIREAYDAIKKNRGFNGGAQKQRKTKKLIKRKKLFKKLIYI